MEALLFIFKMWLGCSLPGWHCEFNLELMRALSQINYAHGMYVTSQEFPKSEAQIGCKGQDYEASD